MTKREGNTMNKVEIRESIRNHNGEIVTWYRVWVDGTWVALAPTISCAKACARAHIADNSK